MHKSSIVLAALLLAGAVQAGAQEAPAASAEAARPGKERDYERIGRFIYAYHRAGVSRERLTDPVLARRAPSDLSQRAAALANRIDEILAKPVTASDAELKATLREAELVGAAIAHWWREQGGT